MRVIPSEFAVALCASTTVVWSKFTLPAEYPLVSAGEPRTSHPVVDQYGPSFSQQSDSNRELRQRRRRDPGGVLDERARCRHDSGCLHGDRRQRFGRRSAAGDDGTSYVDTNVTAGTFYTYRVRAFAGTVASAYSNSAWITAPVAPTNLTATVTTSRLAGIRLSWTNNAPTATTYSVERLNAATGTGVVLTSKLSGTATSYVDSTATVGVTYSYRVRAFVSTVASPYSNTVSIIR